jgi:ATP-binding protein involved in chromosome partitioning
LRATRFEEFARMPTITEAAVLKALATVQEPELGGNLVARNMIKDLVVDGARVSLTIELTTPACPLKDEIESRVKAALDPLGVEELVVGWSSSVRRATPSPLTPQMLPGVKNIIAVASGKGGVGKSTISANLAVALAQSGATVGLLDADITGPNIPMMMGAEGQPVAGESGKITPIMAHGVKVISIQFFLPEGQPIVWRGPLVGGAIQQFLRDVDWGELDYLVVDLPPGTSDAQLTLAQSVPITGAVLVTTPQEVALSDVAKALAMFKRVSVPILGLVENMSGFVCVHCGGVTDPFGRGGGERWAAENNVDFLGAVPLDVTVRQGADVGIPAVAQSQPGPAAAALEHVARAVAGKVSIQAAREQPVLTVS